MMFQRGWQPHGEQFVMACAACEHERKSPVCSDCLKEKRSGFVPKKNFAPTNADRIRAMSDEELAAYLAEMGSNANNGVIYSDRDEEWLEYLQQPAEEAPR